MFFADLSKRPDLISNVLSSLNSVRQDASRTRVPSIGGRTEAELFSLVNAGFALNHIECVNSIVKSTDVPSPGCRLRR